MGQPVRQASALVHEGGMCHLVKKEERKKKLIMLVMMMMINDNDSDGGAGDYQEPAETMVAREMFGGRLSEDFIADKVGHSNFAELLELDFPQSGIQSVILSDGQLFTSLRRFFFIFLIIPT